MMHIKIILPLAIGLNVLACSMDVKKAHAPTAPPSIEKSNFKSSQLLGDFTAGTTLMFLWPEKILDETSNTLVPMTFSQKAESRKNIVRFSDEKDVYEAEFLKASKELDAKYNTLLSALIESYQESKCYSLCDVEDFTCEPDNPDILFQDTWKIPVDDVEAELIQQCQANESDRKEIGADKKAEALQTVTPLQKKAGAAALALLNAVGDRNFFNDLSGFDIRYAPLAKGCFKDGLCLKDNSGKMGMMVRVHFKGGSFSNAIDDGAIFSVSDIVLDREEGFLTFTIPAIKFEDDNRVYGEIVFDLELNPGIGTLNVVGDIRLKNFDDGTERIGRLSSSGPLVPAK